jgi:TetR/AcrR family transcriptional repressor of mexJK operon
MPIDQPSPSQSSPPRLRRKPRDIALALASVERGIAAGQSVKVACGRAGVSVPSFYRWRAQPRNGALRVDKSRESILDAAKSVFMREGYGTSLDAIARAAQVSRQTLYNQFKNKEHLFKEVLLSVHEKIVSPILVWEKSDDFHDNLEKLGRIFLNVSLDEESLALQRIAVGEHRHTPEPALIFDAVRKARSLPPVTEVLTDYLSEQMGREHIRKGDPRLMAEAFLGAISGMAKHRIMIGAAGDPPERQEALLRLSVEIFAAGLGHPRESWSCPEPVMLSDEARRL